MAKLGLERGLLYLDKEAWQRMAAVLQSDADEIKGWLAKRATASASSRTMMAQSASSA